MPVFKLVKIGVWENGLFIGAIIFGVGASAVNHIQYNLKSTEVCELVRVALNKHITPVTKIISISIYLLKKNFTNLRLITSFADQDQGHLGIIYQAGNWVYAGESECVIEYYYNGDWRHVTDVYKRLSKDNIKRLNKRKKPPKYKYIYPLDKELIPLCKKLSKPYPKHAPIA